MMAKHWSWNSNLNLNTLSLKLMYGISFEFFIEVFWMKKGAAMCPPFAVVFIVCLLPKMKRRVVFGPMGHYWLPWTLIGSLNPPPDYTCKVRHDTPLDRCHFSNGHFPPQFRALPHWRLPSLTLASSMRLAESGDTTGWYAQVSHWLNRHGLHIDRLPPFQYNLDAPPSILPPRDEINRIIRLDLLQTHISQVWIEAQELPTKTHFYHDHFMRISNEGFIIRPQYLKDQWVSHALRVAIGFPPINYRLRLAEQQAHPGSCVSIDYALWERSR